MSSSKRIIGFIQVIAAAAIWGTLAVLLRSLTLPATAIVAYRAVITLSVAAAYLFFNASARAFSPAGLSRYLIALGAILGLNNFLFISAVRETTVANAVLMTYLAPVFVAVIAPFWLKEALRPVTVWALTLSIIGVVLISASSAGGLASVSSLALIFGVGSGLCYALVIIISKRVTASLNAMTIIFFQYLYMSMIFWPAMISSPVPPLDQLLILAVLGIVHNLLAAALYLRGLRFIKAQAAAVMTYVDPLSSVVYAAVLLREIPSALSFLGGALIVYAGYLTVSKSQS